MSIFRIMINSFLIFLMLFLSSISVSGGNIYECDVNIIWVGMGNTYNKKRTIKIINNEESILLEGKILKFQFDKYLQNENILVGVKNENDKAFSSMSLRLDTMRYKAIISTDGDEEYHYGNCFWQKKKQSQSKKVEKKTN